jgi:hypothetical protein
MWDSWLPPQWHGRQRIAHPVNWARLPEFDIGVAFVQTKADHGHENRWYLYVRRFNDNDVKAIPVLASTVITSSPGTTQTITSDPTWGNPCSVEVIGAGARGAHGSSTSTSGGGGGGGAYTKIDSSNLTITIPTPGTTPMYCRVGGVTATDGTAGGDTWWTLTSPGTTYPGLGATAVAAKGGTALASATANAGGAGGPQSNSYPSGGGEVRASGGNGGNAGGASAAAGGGGGGAAGTSPGLSPGTGPSAGGSGNSAISGGGTGGAAGSPGVAGGAGTNIDGTRGSGGGGGGGNAAPSTGGAGGLYGGGGGGGGRSTGVGGQGAQGVIVLTWTPAPITASLDTTEVADASVITGKAEWLAQLAATENFTYELLCHFEGNDASTIIADSGGKNQTVTCHGAAEIDTGSSSMGFSSLKLGADADYISVDSGSFGFGTGDFCIDFLVKLSSGSEQRMLYDGGSGGFQILYDGSTLKFVSPAGTITGGSSLGSGNDTHVAVTRASGSTRMFKNGTQDGSTLTDTTNYTASSGYPRMGGSTAPGPIAASLAATEVRDTATFTGVVASGYDTATDAWITAVGGSNVDSNHAGYVDTLIKGLKTDGIWTKCDRIWLFAAQNTASAYCDLKVPTTPAFGIGTMSFTADRGFTLSASGYVRLTYDPVADASAFTQDAGHFSIWNLTAGASTDPVFNYVGGVGNLHIYPEYSGGDCYCRVNESSTGAFTISGATGFLLGNRSDASTVQAYKNGTALGGSPQTVASTSRISQQLNIYNRQIAAFTIGGSLTSTEQGNFYTRLRTYMTSVGVP